MVLELCSNSTTQTINKILIALLTNPKIISKKYVSPVSKLLYHLYLQKQNDLAFDLFDEYTSALPPEYLTNQDTNLKMGIKIASLFSLHQQQFSTDVFVEHLTKLLFEQTKVAKKKKKKRSDLNLIWYPLRFKGGIRLFNCGIEQIFRTFESTLCVDFETAHQILNRNLIPFSIFATKIQYRVFFGDFGRWDLEDAWHFERLHQRKEKTKSKLWIWRQHYRTFGWIENKIIPTNKVTDQIIFFFWRDQKIIPGYFFFFESV